MFIDFCCVLKRKIVLDRCKSSYRECRSVCVRFEEDCTAGRNIRRELAVQSWKFSEEELLQGTTDRIEEAYVGFFMKFNFNAIF